MKDLLDVFVDDDAVERRESLLKGANQVPIGDLVAMTEETAAALRERFGPPSDRRKPRREHV
jgi:hypothetical protein